MMIEFVDDDKCPDCGHEDDGYHYGTCAQLKLAKLEREVVEAALACDSVYLRRLSTWPEDDELHFACRALLAARAAQSPPADNKP
jgi:hypothetical protein